MTHGTSVKKCTIDYRLPKENALIICFSDLLMNLVVVANKIFLTSYAWQQPEWVTVNVSSEGFIEHFVPQQSAPASKPFSNSRVKISIGVQNSFLVVIKVLKPLKIFRDRFLCL